MIEVETVLKPLYWGIYALGAACLVRGNIFGIVIDTARIAIPTAVYIAVSTSSPQAVAVPIALFAGLLVWAAAMLAFFVSREYFGADDILLSLGFQATVFGLSSFALVEFFGSNLIRSPVNYPEAEAPALVAVCVVSAVTIYLLSFSIFRVHLAHAHHSRRATAAYPFGTRLFRCVTTILATLCIFVGVLAAMSIEDPNINQWSDGLGIILFGLAYALKGRALVTFGSAALVGATHSFMSDHASFELPGVIKSLLPLGHIVMGAAIIALAFFFPSIQRSAKKVAERIRNRASSLSEIINPHKD